MGDLGVAGHGLAINRDPKLNLCVIPGPITRPALVVPMSDLERLLAPGCAELPACRCGEEMRLDHTDPARERADTQIRVYKCPACHHEMRLTVWAVEPREPCGRPPVD